jgi:hypothetical protein
MTIPVSSLAEATASAAVADTLRIPELWKSINRGELTKGRLADMILDDLAREARGDKGPALFPNMRALLRTQMNVEELKLRGGMGQWAELAAAVTGAAAGIIGAKITAKAQASVAKTSLQQSQLALRSAEIQAASDRAALAMQQGAPAAAAAARGGGGVGGLPSWLIPVGVGVVVLGVGAVILLRR